MDLIEGVTLTPLKIIDGPLGGVMHALKGNESSYQGFGEAYFSIVNKGAVKGWKKHTRMVLNLVVPNGKVKFVVYDDRESNPTPDRFFMVELSPKENYQRLTVQPGLWVAFEGMDTGVNLVLNMASIAHDPSEAVVIPLAEGKINYPRG